MSTPRLVATVDVFRPGRGIRKKTKGGEEEAIKIGREGNGADVARAGRGPMLPAHAVRPV